MPALRPGLPALRPGLEPEFGSAPGPGYWPPSGLAVENAQVEKALAEAEPAEGALSEGLAVELAVEVPTVEVTSAEEPFAGGLAGPFKVVGRQSLHCLRRDLLIGWRRLCD